MGFMSRNLIKTKQSALAADATKVKKFFMSLKADYGRICITKEQKSQNVRKSMILHRVLVNLSNATRLKVQVVSKQFMNLKQVQFIIESV